MRRYQLKSKLRLIRVLTMSRLLVMKARLKAMVWTLRAKKAQRVTLKAMALTQKASLLLAMLKATEPMPRLLPKPHESQPQQTPAKVTLISSAKKKPKP